MSPHTIHELKLKNTKSLSVISWNLVDRLKTKEGGKFGDGNAAPGLYSLRWAFQNTLNLNRKECAKIRKGFAKGRKSVLPFVLNSFFSLAMPQQTNYHDPARNCRQFCVQNTAVYLELSRLY